MSANILVIGNMAADPDLRTTAKGTQVCNFTVISSRSTKNADGQWENVDVTAWPCTAWGSLAETIVAHFHKGEAVMLYGAASEKSWVNKEGEERNRLELTVKEAGFRLKKGYNDNLPETKKEPEGDPWSTPAPF